MEKRFIVTALLITLLSVVFSMSGDGGNVPVVKNESTENVDNQVADNTNNEINVPEVNTGTVKDQFGIDTGMTKDELDKFKAEYLELQKQSGIYYKDPLYYHKTNLNAISKLADYDVKLNRLYESCTANDFAVRSEIVAVVSYIDFDVEENKELTYPVTFNVKVHEIIQNNTEYEILPDTLMVKGTNFASYPLDEYKIILSKKYDKDDKYVLFLSRYNFYYFSESHKEGRRKEIVDETCFHPFTFAFIGYQRKIENNEIIFDETKNPPVYINLDQFKKNVKEINQINDVSNFYKRSYK